MTSGVSVDRGPPPVPARVVTPPSTGFEVYRAHWDASREGLFSVRVLGPDDFVFEGINRPLQLASGLDEAAFVGRRPEDVLDPEGAASVLGRYRECIRRCAPLTYFETLNLPVGRTRWKTSLTPVGDDRGLIVRLAGVAREVRPGRSSAGALSRARREYQRSIDLTPNHVAVLDAAGGIVLANVAWRRFGQRHAGMRGAVGLNYLEVCDGAARGDTPEAALIAVDLRKMLSGRLVSFLSLPYASAGFHFIVRATPLELAGIPHVIMSHQDVTQLFEVQQMLTQTTERLLAVQEEERARIGVELHDSTSQHLAAIGLGLAALRRCGGAPGEVLDDMSTALAEAQKEIRSLTYLLHPPKLSRQGLEPTLQSFVEGFRRRTGLAIDLRIAGSLGQLSFEVQRAAFRVIQEALGNVHRHAAATRASVAIVLNPRGLHLTVSDDGSARQPAGARVDGVGIPGMSARMRQFGGALKVRRRRIGTLVFGFIPHVGLSNYGGRGRSGSAAGL